MKTVLYVDCCIRRELSRTRLLAEAFIEALREHPGYQIQTLCLMDLPLQYLNDTFFTQREDLRLAGQFDHPRFRYARAFQQADKIVIAAPFWDLTFPALLKVYIENVSLDGITFHCDENGCRGACLADRLLFFTTRGGKIAGSPLEIGSHYMRALTSFFGIPRFDCIAAEGLDLGLEPVESILAPAIEAARAIARNF